MSGRSTVTWLKTASAIVIGFGFVMALAAHPSTSAVPAWLLDLIFWPLNAHQTIAGEEIHLLSAISGGIMVGWGLLLWLVSARLYPRDPQLARLMIMVSIISWFCIDSLGSVISGAPLNVLFNTGFLALFVVPLMRAAQPMAADAS